MEQRGGVWIGATPGKSGTGQHTLQSYEGASFDRHALHLPEGEYNDYYLGYSNSVLWPLFHGRTDLLDVEEGQLAAYSSVNRKMAEASVNLIQEGDVILTVKLKAETGNDEMPLDFTFTKVDDNWRIARINRVNA